MKQTIQQPRRIKKRRAGDDTPLSDSSITEGGDSCDDKHRSKKVRSIRVSAAIDRTPVTPGARGKKSRVKVEQPSPSSQPIGIFESTDQPGFRSTFSSTPTHTHSTSIAAPPSPPSFAEGMVATPPVVDEDLNPLVEFTDPRNGTSKTSNAVLDASHPSPQDVTLPSPVASPVSSPSNRPQSTHDLDLDTDPLQLVRNEKEIHGNEMVLAQPNGVVLPQLVHLQFNNMMNFFDDLSDDAQKYFLYELLRRSDTSQLRFIAEQVNPALKCDFITQLPLELSYNIIRYLDAQSLCRAAQVSRRWREIIDADDKAWRDLLERDGYHVSSEEVARAVREGWQWQGLMPYEKDLSREMRDLGYQISSHPSVPQISSPVTSPTSIATASRMVKRKHGIKHEHSHKRRKISEYKTEQASTKVEFPKRVESSSQELEIREMGLSQLRIPHLYKTIYRRHYCIKETWMKQGSRPQHLAFRAHGRHVVTCLQFDDEKVLTGSDDTRIHVYNSTNGSLRKVLHGHDGGVWALQYDGNTLVSGSTDRTVRVWEIDKGRCRHVFHGHTSTVRCLVILKPAIIGYTEGGQPIRMPKRPLIITGSRDTSLRVWRLPEPNDPPFNQNGDVLHEDMNPYFIRALMGHRSSVRAIAAHGDTLVSGSYDSTVRVWKISTGETLHQLTGHTSKVYSVILDHERNRCISGSMDTMVKVWSLETGQCLINLEGHSSLVGLLDLGHGKLVSAAADSSLRIWNPETGHCKSTLLAHTGAITCFQHDQQKVISGSDRALKLWNVQTGEIVKDLLVGLSGGWQVKFNDRKCVAAVQRRQRTYIEVTNTDSMMMIITKL
jgi:F-box and WD-40 domain protein CDC4